MCLRFGVVFLLASIGQLVAVTNSATIQYGGCNVTLRSRTQAIRECSSCPKEYLVGTKKVTWYQASVLCQQNGMELISINSASEENAIEAILANYSTTVGPNNGYWTSATRNGACSTEFVWFSGGKSLIYNNFGPGQPDNAGKIESCIELILENANKYSWNDLSCENKIGFICQSKCCKGQ
ncbi:C-type lectin 37Db-like isoform X6 [Anthonomus grandis grandis]|uniref:C-type lectin 37Db-like isoform X4 n=1 Tax=Anthonomus grandis grandis TaxID=2921223 RepID=UPI00216685F4|nr:C-type lectin 37Db-like isoform X4 [Anthonomus grandis grandis]XP_050309059.1 C-type lectin 37Db-like isoform X5 [Anthonomus grandis grandis]XP_050309060.1 C-type lectin 37Db-like isoform X6 [Anthonomus grandis grandis]